MDSPDGQVIKQNQRGHNLAPEEDWLKTGCGRVVDGAFAAIRRHAGNPVQAPLLDDVLRNGLEAQPGSGVGRCWLATRLPLLIGTALADPAPPELYAVASAITLVDAGIYALDQIMDREVEGALGRHPAGAVLLGAVTLVGVVPTQMLLRLADHTMALDLARMLADGLGRVGDGQLREIARCSMGKAETDAVATAVRLKSGERRAIYAALAARCVGASPERIAGCAAFGRALGVARQLHSDLMDLFGPGRSRDLLSQTVTLPLALYLERTDADSREEMQALLAEQRDPDRVKAAVRARLKQGGLLREVVGMIEAQCAQARAALDGLGLTGPAALALRELICGASVIG